MCIFCELRAELEAKAAQGESQAEAGPSIGQTQSAKQAHNDYLFNQADLDHQRAQVNVTNAQAIATLANAAKTLEGINATKEKEAVLATLMDLLPKDSVAPAATAPTRDPIPGEDELPKELRDLIAALGGELGAEVRVMRFPKA